MREQSLSSVELMSVWEKGMLRSPAEKAALLLSLASQSDGDPAPEKLTVGQGGLRLLHMREVLLGSTFSAVARCPSCDAKLDVTFSASDVRDDVPETGSSSLTFAEDGYVVAFHPPTIGDLLSLRMISEPSGVEAHLLARCVEHATLHGQPREVPDLPDHIVRRIVEEMSTADPAADIQFALSCELCGATSTVPFDIASYLWAELDVWAQHVLQDVHVIASHYGWTEPTILQLSHFRRQAYIAMIGRG